MKPSLPLVSIFGFCTLSGSAWGNIDKDENVILFPTFATWNQTQEAWRIPVHAWVYEPETNARVRAAALRVFGTALGMKRADIDQAEFAARARMFIVDNERGQRLQVRVEDRQFELEQTKANGHTRGEFLVEAPAQRTAPFAIEAILPADDERRFTGLCLPVAPTGLSVISDIDDTIKVSQVRNKRKLLEHTFIKEFQEVEGMADLYQTWAARGARFHYLSASPWQLYPPLSSFMEDRGFPPGSMSLKTFRAKDSTFFDLFASPRAWKTPQIEHMLNALPRRQFILVGDSGESDPEIYGEIARRHREQVAAVYIRDVTEQGPDDPRYAQAFDALPRELWQVFDRPAQVVPAPVQKVDAP